MERNSQVPEHTRIKRAQRILDRIYSMTWGLPFTSSHISVYVPGWRVPSTEYKKSIQLTSNSYKQPLLEIELHVLNTDKQWNIPMWLNLLVQLIHLAKTNYSIILFICSTVLPKLQGC